MQETQALSRKRVQLSRGQGSSFSQKMVLIIVPDIVCDNMAICFLALLLMDMERHLRSIQTPSLPTAAFPDTCLGTVSWGMLSERTCTLSYAMPLFTVVWCIRASGMISSSRFRASSWTLVWEEKSLSP